MESGLILDISMTLSSCDDPLSEEIKPVLDKFHSLLNSAIFDNNENSRFRQNYEGGEEERQEQECQSGL